MALNSVVIHGHLTRDVDSIKSQTGTPIAAFCVAVPRNVAKNGVREADFIDCKAFNNTAETICKYCKKGSEIIVEGRIQVRKYTDKDGTSRKAYDVVAERFDFCGKKESGASPATNAPAQNDYTDVDDADLPF